LATTTSIILQILRKKVLLERKEGALFKRHSLLCYDHGEEENTYKKPIVLTIKKGEEIRKAFRTSGKKKNLKEGKRELFVQRPGGGGNAQAL